jgi:hypothetical protein
MFEEEITSLYQIEVAPRRRNMFEIDIDVTNDNELYMLDSFHTQAVATTGRSEIAQLVTSELTDMAVHASYAMAQTVEKINRYETAAQAGRLGKRLQNFNDILVDDTGRNVSEANRITALSMYGDMRTSIYKPASPPKRKGVFRSVKEFFTGEE